MTDRLRDERGVVGGADMLVFGFLIFVVGSLLIVNAWTVVDSWLAVSAASREGARVFVEAGPDEAVARSRTRVLEVMDDYGRGDRASAPHPEYAAFERCALVTVHAQYEMAFIHLPFIGSFGALSTIDATHTERIDPFRSGDFEGGCR